MNIPILFEDNHLLIVEKPVNIPVQEDASRDPDLLSLLKKDLKVRYQKPGNVYLALIHRLDRPVGGAIVFAKTSKAASRMATLLRQRAMERMYLAVVRGKMRVQAGELVHYLKKDPRKNFVRIVQPSVAGAKMARLRFQVLYKTKNLSLLLVKLVTGRSHQIRVQLSAIGHPLYGDQKYGKAVNIVGEQLALWSYELSFIHPVTKQPLTIQSYPPNMPPWQQTFYQLDKRLLAKIQKQFFP